MSEDLTRQLPDDALTQILGAIRELGGRMDNFERRMDAFESRIENLDRKVDERLYDTRPIWEQVLADVEHLRQGQARLEERQQRFEERLERLEAGQQRLSHEFEDGWRRFERKLRAMSDSWLELKADYTYLDRRLGELEEPPA